MSAPILTIRNEFLSVAVSPQGGELQSVKTAEDLELLWQGDATYWSDRSPNLFPYVGRLWNGEYRLNGRTYPMTIHGFIHGQLLEVAEHTADTLTLAFRDTEETRAIYPFRFRFAVTYRVEGAALAITYQVDNQGDATLYFGVGGHPGFRTPLEEGRRFEDYVLRFEPGVAPVRLGFSDICYRTGEDTPYPLDAGGWLPLQHTLFDDDAIVLADCGHAVELCPAHGSGAGVRVEFPDMPYLGIWHRPHTDAPYVCLEPWASLPSRHGEVPSFEEQEDLISLPAGETYRNRWVIRPIVTE